MIPVITETTNCILKGSTPDVIDLPVTRFQLGDIPAVQSCWQLTDEEVQEVLLSGKMYFSIYGRTHPPICLSAVPFVEEVDS